MIITGTFGNIYSGMYLSQKCAIKTVQDIFKDSILNADFFLRYLHTESKASSYIVKRLGIERDTIQTSLITELLDTNLAKYVNLHPGGLTLEKTKSITKKIAEALEFLDESGVVYTNLKPSRILLSLDAETVKLSHFEQAYFKEDPYLPREHTIEDSYKSPEIILGIRHSSPSNIWALSLIINGIFTGCFYVSIPLPQIIAAHQVLLQKPYPHELIESGSQEGKELFKESSLINLASEETLEQTLRRTANLKVENPEQIEDLISLLYEMLSYTNRPTAQEVLELPFFNSLCKKRKFKEIQKPLIATPFHGLVCKESLGSGGFGDVFEGILEENGIRKEYAIKISKQTSEAEECLFQEDRKLRLLQRDPEAFSYIVNRLALYEQDQKLQLVFERMNMDLDAYIDLHEKGLSIEKTRHFTKQLAKGLLVLFRMNMLHLDIKPKNILLSFDKNSVKLCDFGLACFKDRASLPSNHPGTNKWKSPEALLEGSFTTASDVWGLGATLSKIFTGFTPFNGDSETEIIAYHHIRLKKQYPQDLVDQGSKNGQLTFKKALTTTLPSFRSLSQIIEQSCLTKSGETKQTKLFIDLLYEMLEFHPSKRIAPDQLLNHPFLKEAIS